MPLILPLLMLLAAQQYSMGTVAYQPGSAIIYTHIIGSGTYIMLIPSGIYYTVTITVDNYLAIYMVSNESVVLYILNSTNYHRFEEGLSYEAAFGFTGNVLNTTLFMSPGDYYVVVINDNYGIAYVELSLLSANYTPVINAPMGIVDYGLLPTNIGIIPYSYTTNEFLGHVWIGNISATAITPTCNGIPSDAFTIQLNAFVEVKVQNEDQYYWVQDALMVMPSEGIITPMDNLWNMTTRSLYLNSSFIEGLGSVINNKTYIYSSEPINYSLPINAQLVINVSRNKTGYPIIHIGYSMGHGISWFDNITLLIRPTWGPYLVVNGSETTGSNNLVDVEFVIGGPGCSTASYIKDINAKLSLYFNSSAGLMPVPSSWSFASNTGETVVNVHVRPLGNGTVALINGQDNPGPLPNNDVVQALVINNLLINNSLTNIVELLPRYYSVNLTIPRYAVFSNGTMLNLLNITVNNITISTTSLSILLNSSYDVTLNWQLLYHLIIVDPLSIVSNMSGWYPAYSVVSITLKPMVTLSNGTRYVLSSLNVSSNYYLKQGNSLLIIMNEPTILIINWTKEYNVTLILYTLNDTFLGTYYLGWLSEGEVLKYVVINGTEIMLKAPVNITAPLIKATADMALERFVIRDYLGLPAPFTVTYVVCGPYEVRVVSNYLGFTNYVLIPTDLPCIVRRPIISYYTAAAIMTVFIIALLLVMLYRPHRNITNSL